MENQRKTSKSLYLSRVQSFERCAGISVAYTEERRLYLIFLVFLAFRPVLHIQIDDLKQNNMEVPGACELHLLC